MWPRISAVSQLVLLIYLQVVEWVDLYPWNDVRRGNGQEMLDIALGVVMTGTTIVTLLRWRPGIIFAALLYAVWLGLQIWTFWIPYAAGASERWARVHAANFAETIQVFPMWENHLPPDANHFVLQVLIAWALVATVMAAFRPRDSKHAA